MPDRRNLILCADDFPLDRPVAEAVLRLADQGRLSAVSCLTQAPLWKPMAPLLAQLSGKVAIGLHLDLTQSWRDPSSFPGSCPGSPPESSPESSLRQLMLRSLTSTLDLPAIRNRLQRQWDEFAAAIGREPDFVDGHQHVHVFPGIAAVLDGFLHDNAKAATTPVRAITPFFGKTDAVVKRRVLRFLAALSAWPDRPDLVALNTAFAGDYSLSTNIDYAMLFENWLGSAPDRGLIMCHPSYPADGAQPHNPARSQEFEFLSSARFPETLSEQRIRLLFPRTNRSQPGSDIAQRTI